MKTMPTTARWTAALATLLVASTIFLAACANDVTNPSAAKIAPTDANKALVGAVDGVYTVTLDPSYGYTLPLGKSYMVLPANAICAIGTSGYGASYWNSPCKPQTAPVTITAIVRGAETDNPSVEFQPAMRFNPNTTVTLHIYVTNTATLDNLTVMKYCSTTNALLGVGTVGSCVDESLTDPDLTTSVDVSQGLVFRRIKHFSGYIVAE